ncbi:hypothetical protein EJ06DRAFT_474375 [Trichodelitschia bisporula]|uniref:Endoplasmic reticulum protein n=1 Tax=Trichodelitschia bisporula TaxID=703511 RepID=A0A6G1I1K7_9PEZI|nr:hypothetical protein EJ06DRAFT_474375 [Trichodelitschia bisporula]
MAGPPPGNLSLQERLMRIAQTLQFAWFVGHVAVLVATLKYIFNFVTFSYNTRGARFSYRTAFLFATITYGIVVYKGYRARLRQNRSTGFFALIGDENVQYLIMAFIWLFSPVKVSLAVLPFSVYSVFHVATYTRANLLPALQGPQPAGPDGRPKSTGLHQTIGDFVKEYYDQSMFLVALLEISLWVRILISVIFFRRGSWILFALYTAFIRARFSQSPFVQSGVSQLVSRVDAIAANQQAPPQVRAAWETIKGFGRQATEATDLSRYAGGKLSGGNPSGPSGSAGTSSSASGLNTSTSSNTFGQRKSQ